jgi:hypothetical protein
MKELVAYAWASRTARRAPLLAAMQSAAAAGRSCAGCSGLCCTSVANSMQVTPLEALDLYLWLLAEGRWDEALVATLHDCATRYGLDRPPLGDGRRVFSRRHYTCPFFVGGARGCSVSRHAKPYGCLAFNSRRAGVREGEDCGSDQPLLEARESVEAGEAQANGALQATLAGAWDKRPLPTALLAVASQLGDSKDLLAGLVDTKAESAAPAITAQPVASKP